MATVIRELIKYEGIESCRYTSGAFKQMNIENTFCIPIKKTDIKEIVKVLVKQRICKYKIIKTPIGKSLEGQNLTGYKILIIGELKLEYQYISLEKKQGIHTVCTIIPVGGYVVMPEIFNPCEIIYPIMLIEDINCKKVSNRCIYTNMTIMLNVDIC